MSNFSHNENLHEQNSYSETESETNDCDKTVAFLAALQETQNVLNVLLQAVLYRENTDSYEENSSKINISLESNDQSKENQINYKNVNEPTKNANGSSRNLLVPTFISSTETIPVVSPSIDNLQMIALPWITQNSLELNNICVHNNKDQQVPAERRFNNPFNESNPITNLNRQDSDNKVDSEQPPVVYELEVESLVDLEKTKYYTKRNVSTTLDYHNNSLTKSYPIPAQNSLKPHQLTIEQKLFQKLGILKNEKEEILQVPVKTNNSKDCRSSTTNDCETDLVTADIPAKEKGLSDIEEIKKLLEYSQNSYISCENKINTILNQIHNESVDNMPNDESFSNPFCTTTQSILKPMSNLQREIEPREFEKKKTTVLHLPPESIPNSSNRCEKEMAGDDFAKTNTQILCECGQPGVDGGAVPVVTSFTVTQENCLKGDEKLSDIKTQKETRVFNREKENTPQKPKYSQIPKPTSFFKNADRSNLLGRTEKQRCLIPSLNREENEEEKPHVTLNISPKMLSLKEKLKATTSLIRQKINNNEEKPDDEKNKSEKLQLRFDDESYEKRKLQKKLRHEFSQNINRVTRDANNLREIGNLRAQAAAIDTLYKYITELKRLSNELNDIQNTEDDKSQDVNDDQPPSLESEHKSRVKDNKIYIKFLPTKSGIKKRKSCNTEVQTESTKYSVSQVVQADSETTEKKSEENCIKDVDSVDGMFIPSLEEPPKMEEDEDEDGLDITITFPEFQQHIMHQASSHQSVCFSDISAEALCRLKRCPKEFTLRMDFVQGKMFFQSGRSPANNFSIGPDLKITECNIDDKMSDIISIKPSTECMYTSQLIPVEGSKQKSSIRTLKSTDSELFNVVSLPTINKKTSGNTKSCITFKNERCISTGSLLSNRRSYKSMPQIPSLTKILEEPTMESASTSRSAMMNSDKKPKTELCKRKKPIQV